MIDTSNYPDWYWACSDREREVLRGEFDVVLRTQQAYNRWQQSGAGVWRVSGIYDPGEDLPGHLQPARWAQTFAQFLTKRGK